VPNGYKIYQHLPLQDPPKFTQIGIFGLKIYHLAILHHMSIKKFHSYGGETFTFNRNDRGCQIKTKIPIWEGLVVEAVGIFYSHLVNFPAIWYILWPIDIFFPRVGILHQEKSGNPGSDLKRENFGMLLQCFFAWELFLFCFLDFGQNFKVKVLNINLLRPILYQLRTQTIHIKPTLRSEMLFPPKTLHPGGV
jgi:hypothetical protein